MTKRISNRNRAGKQLAQNIGQLLVVGFDGTEMTSRLSSLLTPLQPAGVILFARNIRTPEQTWRLLGECQKCVAAPLFTCVDLEGGSVDRLRDALGPTPSAAEVFASADRRLYGKHGSVIGENCRALGFNVDFAPVLDLAFEASRQVMSSRAVSADARQTIAYARRFLAGLRLANVLGCGKHFPGLGEGRLDSHHELPVIDKSLKQLWAEDLLPYRRLRQALSLVMISHAAYPQVTGDKTPASLSKRWITDILRKRIGFRGLIVSDDLEMGGVLSAAPIGQAAVEFLRAGGHLCLVCHREDRVTQVLEQITKTAERDKQFVRRVEEAGRRVMAFKKKRARMLRPAPQGPSAAAIEKLTRCLWEFNEQVRLEAFSRAESTGRRHR
jgi:beta-N-acetylhexosaminidase